MSNVRFHPVSLCDAGGGARRVLSAPDEISHDDAQVPCDDVKDEDVDVDDSKGRKFAPESGPAVLKLDASASSVKEERGGQRSSQTGTKVQFVASSVAVRTERLRGDPRNPFRPPEHGVLRALHGTSRRRGSSDPVAFKTIDREFDYGSHAFFASKYLKSNRGFGIFRPCIFRSIANVCGCKSW